MGNNDQMSKQIHTQKEDKKKSTAAIQKKYLSVDMLHLQQTRMRVIKTLISAFDPRLAESNSPNKRLYGCFKYLLKDTAFSVENKIQCSHMFIAPATPFSLTINNQTCHPEQTKPKRAGGKKTQWSWKRSAIPRKASVVFPQWAGQPHTSTSKPSG